MEEVTQGHLSDDDLLERFPFLRDDNLSDDLKKFLVEKAIDGNNSAWSREFEIRKWRWSTPIAIALTGAITLMFNFVFDYFRSQQAQSAQSEAEERQFEFKIVEYQLNQPISEKDRAQALLFLARAGVLTKLNSQELRSMAEASLKKFENAGEVVLPTLGASAPSPITNVRQLNIRASVFGGLEDPGASAYDGHLIDDKELGVALPYRFQGPRPKVRVFSGDKSVICNIVDVGPWNINDPYWQNNTRPQAETGTDSRGRKTNGLGIDLTPAAFRLLGLSGIATVDWEFF